MAARWRKFEQEVAAFFERAGFQVAINSKVAHPRQTDVFAHDENPKLLIEAKNRKRAIDVGDIDALRSRLNRMPSDVIGVIFSSSRLSNGAKIGIETDRTREIVTFVEQEIDLLRAGRQNIRSLVEQKRHALMLDGKVWQCSERPSRFLSAPLPSGDVSFQLGKSRGPHFESRSRFSGASYTLDIHDTGWGGVGGEGARLTVQLALNEIKDLRDLLGYLHKMFGLSKSGMFFIHQSETCCHGVGAEQFIDAAQHWRDRYAASRAKTFHHSEEFAYYDSFHTGWVHVSAQQRVGMGDPKRSSFLHHAEVVIQLPGVPVDTARFVSLCRYANNDWAHFEYISERWTRSRRLKAKRKLDVVGKVVKVEKGPNGDESPRQIIIAIIARNPFYRNSSLPKELCDSDMVSAQQLVEAATRRERTTPLRPERLAPRIFPSRHLLSGRS